SKAVRFSGSKGASRGARQRYMVETCAILKRANSPPRITARRGGGVAKKMARSLLIDAPGWCSLSDRSEHHPVLAVMRGGEFAFLKTVPNLDSSASPSVHAVGSGTSPNKFCWGPQYLRRDRFSANFTRFCMTGLEFPNQTGGFFGFKR